VLGTQGAVAIELAEARAEQHRTAMLDDRERIAADVHTRPTRDACT